MNIIDTTRHLPVFSPDTFGKRRIDIIGAGATGSRMVLGLAKLGLDNLHVWDFDKVEAHNIANQVYSQADIGTLKVEALAEIIKQHTGLEIVQHPERVDGSQELGEVVFLLTDTMASRKEIWSKGIRYKMRTKLMIETRMGADEGRIYAVNPTRPAQVKGWEEASQYDDSKAEVSACGTSVTVGPTAEFISGMAQWQLFHWADAQAGKEDKLFHEIVFWVRPLEFMKRRFD